MRFAAVTLVVQDRRLKRVRLVQLAIIRLTSGFIGARTYHLITRS